MEQKQTLVLRIYKSILKVFSWQIDLKSIDKIK
nr:MAG TPA: hypothetical protein [Caudoviricetes sp.]